MRFYLVVALFVFGGVETSEGAEILWFPFDHAVTMTCGMDCYAGHSGLDYACPEGTNIYAAIGGTVVTAIGDVSGQVCDPPNYGNYVKIQNNQHQLQVIHAHLKPGSVVVYGGNTVVAGQYIGKSSNTGYTMARQLNPPHDYVCGVGGAYHLHLEVRSWINNQWSAVNPDTYDGGLWTDPLLYGNDTPPPPPPPTFTCSLIPGSVTLNPAGPYTIGQTVQCQMKFKNEGTGTWQKTGGPSYIELGSCNASGTIGLSFFNYPCPPSQVTSWFNCSVPCTFTETSVAPGQTGTFTFTGKIRDTTPGTYDVYFGPVHNGSVMSGWGQAHFAVAIATPSPRIPYDFDGDELSDAWDRTSDGLFHLDFCDDGLTGWEWTGQNYGGTQDTPCPADYDGDGVWDIAVLRHADRKFLIDYAANNLGWFDVTNLGGYGGYGDTPCPADYDGDGKADIAVRDADGDWHIDYSVGGFGVWDWTGYGYGGSLDTPCAADFDGDGRCDLAVLKNSDRRFYVDYINQGGGFGAWDVSYGGYGGSGDIPCPADYDGDGKADIAVRDADGEFHIDYSVGGFGAWDWTGYGYGSTPDPPRSGDYDGDGLIDIAVYYGTQQVQCFDRRSNGFGAWDACDLGHPTWKTLPPPLTLAFTLDIEPNPVLSATTFSYVLPGDSCVMLRLYNLSGRLVTTLLDEEQPAGVHTLPWQNDHLPSGVYFLQLQTGEYTKTQQLLLLR
ncbi:MAG: peptidoglycan DD-metalloendopeptidase family protein [Candidatus Kerfeldbacteria bacterium]|nr:peptidoglycan DD-metalloendopeptidase family protein [Candidatus Kerfeldbacteria bacterium]